MNNREINGVFYIGIKFVQAIIFLLTHFMKRFFLLILVLISGIIGCMAQETADTTAQPPYPENDSLFLNLTCTLKNTNTIELNWKAAPTGNGDYFVVERSNDDDHYETVGALKIVDTIREYSLTDNSPLDGTGLYRIKYVSKSGTFAYSRAVEVTVPGSVDLKFYPNPADKLLIVRTSHPVDVQILDVMGGLRMQKRLQPGLQIVNIASLEKGTYILNIADKESNKVISEHLLKN